MPRALQSVRCTGRVETWNAFHFSVRLTITGAHHRKGELVKLNSEINVGLIFEFGKQICCRTCEIGTESFCANNCSHLCTVTLFFGLPHVVSLTRPHSRILEIAGFSYYGLSF